MLFFYALLQILNICNDDLLKAHVVTVLFCSIKSWSLFCNLSVVFIMFPETILIW